MLEAILDVLLSVLFIYIYHSDFPQAGGTSPKPSPKSGGLVPKPVAVVPKAIATTTKSLIVSAPPEPLSSLPVARLRQICSERSIVWRNAHGKNKHLTKAQMLRSLRQV